MLIAGRRPVRSSSVSRETRAGRFAPLGESRFELGSLSDGGLEHGVERLLVFEDRVKSERGEGRTSDRSGLGRRVLRRPASDASRGNRRSHGRRRRVPSARDAGAGRGARARVRGDVHRERRRPVGLEPSSSGSLVRPSRPATVGRPPVRVIEDETWTGVAGSRSDESARRSRSARGRAGNRTDSPRRVAGRGGLPGGGRPSAGPCHSIERTGGRRWRG